MPKGRKLRLVGTQGLTRTCAENFVCLRKAICRLWERNMPRRVAEGCKPVRNSFTRICTYGVKAFLTGLTRFLAQRQQRYREARLVLSEEICEIRVRPGVSGRP